MNTSPFLTFYKPFVLTDEFYQGRWFPRGVIKHKDAKKDIVLEIFDSARSNEYMDKIRHQEPERHEYLTWFPNKMGLDAFMDQLTNCLEGLLFPLPY